MTLGWGRDSPYVEYMFRWGLGYNLDWGFKYTFPGPLSVSGKWMFFDRDEWAMAVSLGFGAGYYFGGIEGLHLAWRDRTDVAFIQIPLAYHVSYDIFKQWTLYCSTKYFPVLLFGKGFRETTHNMTFGLGTKIGEKNGVYLETDYYTSFGSNLDGFIFAIGFFSTYSGI